MLQLQISRVMRIRGIRNPYKFLRDLGISHTVVHRFLSGKSKGFKMDQLQKICLALYCTPNDLIDWDNTRSTLSEDHPIQQLNREEVSITLEDLRKLPLERMKDIQKMLEAEE